MNFTKRYSVKTRKSLKVGQKAVSNTAGLNSESILHDFFPHLDC